MKRMSAPFSCMCVAMQWRSRWHAPDLADLRRHDVTAHRPRQMIAAERFALGSQEHREVVRLERELGPRLADVFLSHADRPLADRHVAVFLALALADQDQAPVQLQIEEFQLDDFQPAQSGCSRSLPGWRDRAGPSDRRDSAATSPARSPARRGCSWATCGPGAADRSPKPGCAGCDSAASSSGTTRARAPAARAGCGRSAARRSFCGRRTSNADSVRARAA